MLLGGTLALFYLTNQSNQTGAEMPYPNDPTIDDLITISSEEFYEELYDFGGSYDPMPVDSDEDCPEWIQEQLDEDAPF